MEDNKVVVSKDDLKTLVDVKSAAVLAASQAKSAELEYRNALLSIYLKYKLDPECSINEQTGDVKFPEPVVETKSAE